jgi:hypothetical protein
MMSVKEYESAYRNALFEMKDKNVLKKNFKLTDVLWKKWHFELDTEFGGWLL